MSKQTKGLPFARRGASVLSLCLLMSAALPACDVADDNAEVAQRITLEEVVAAQKTWGDGIVAIGKAYQEKGNYLQLAENQVNTLYGYDVGEVLFKPTKAVAKQFRLNKPDAVSYFVKGVVPEDKGFALQPWSKVRFENAAVIFRADQAIAMGNYYFTDATTNVETKVEYTFGYVRNDAGALVINVHHSSLPFGG